MAFGGNVPGRIRCLSLGSQRTPKSAQGDTTPTRRLAGSLVVCVIAAAALAGCGGGLGSMIVEPERYAAYHCNQMVSEWKNLETREKDLRNLIDKASEGGGGTVIGAVAYRGDYESVLAQKKVLQRTAAEKNCDLVPTYRSDQTIR
jgi:hypothetical protein